MNIPKQVKKKKKSVKEKIVLKKNEIILENLVRVLEFSEIELGFLK